jgi:hypothetical protein
MAYDYYRYPEPPYKGKAWYVELVEPSTELPVGGAFVDDRHYPAKEVVIWATREVNVQRAADLIYSARLVLEGSTLLSHLYPGEHAPIHLVSAKENAALEGDELGFRNRTRVMTSNIPLACLMAARASFRLAYIYGLAKLRLSLELFSFPGVELDPYHSANIPKSPLPEDHVRLAFAITSAWSCVEELGFEIRASSQKPSKLPDGRWNPVVKTELEDRLRRGHVNIGEKFHWNLRGPRTRIERKRPPSIVQKAPWARYDVRDGTMELIDAIHYVSFLRSWIATHKTDKNLLRVLSVYDVTNAQMLARRLLLDNMGVWRYWGSDPENAED